MGKDNVAPASATHRHREFSDEEWRRRLADLETQLWRVKALAYELQEFNDGRLEFPESGLEPPGAERRARANANGHLYDVMTDALHREIDATFHAVWPEYFGPVTDDASSAATS